MNRSELLPESIKDTEGPLPPQQETLPETASDPATHRRYVHRLLAGIAIYSAVVFTVGAYLGPFEGDLTRVGGFPEREYGWSEPQGGFRQPLSEYGHYDRYYDMVVLGDSFSNTGHPFQWQNYVAARTGWSIVTLDTHHDSISSVLDNPVYKKTPPRLFVFERVERWLPKVFAEQPKSCDPSYGNLQRQFKTQPLNAESVAGDYRHKSGAYFSHGYVFAYLERMLRRRLNEELGAFELPLNRGDLFSNRKPESILIYLDDVTHRPWSEATIERIRCGLADYSKRTEANGKTVFVALLVPDKLTAYEPYIENGRYGGSSRLKRIMQDPNWNPDLLGPTRAGLAQGFKDLYLPNDTHWGGAGHRLAASILLRTIGIPDSDSMAAPHSEKKE